MGLYQSEKCKSYKSLHGMRIPLWEDAGEKKMVEQLFSVLLESAHAMVMSAE